MRLLSALAIVFAMYACAAPQNEGQKVARVYDNYLYLSDLKGVVPEGISGDDSAMIIKSYIDNWIRQAVILHHAERNVDLQNIEMQQQINDYRNSLLVYYYEQGLADTKLDTAVSEERLRDYYAENKTSFLLTTNMYRVAYVNVPSSAPDIDALQENMTAEDKKSRNELVDYCLRHAVKHSLNDTSWYSYEMLQGMLPLQDINPEDIVIDGPAIKVNHKNSVFLIAFKDMRRKDEISPYALERKNIYNIILNKRKLELLATMEKAIYQDALGNNDFEIY